MALGWIALVGFAWWQAYHRDLARCRGNSGWLYWDCVDAQSIVRDNILLAGVAVPFAVLAFAVLRRWPNAAPGVRASVAHSAASTMPKAIRDAFEGRSTDAP